MNQAVIFDLDGTLVDSLADIAAAMNEVLDRHGYSPHPVPAYRRFVGDGVEKLVERAVPGADGATVARLVEEMRRTYRNAALRTTRPYPGIPELLEGLTAAGIPFAVLTNKPHGPAVEMIQALLGKWKFAAVQGAVPDLPRKPDPAGARMLARRMGVEPNRCVLVGDTATDMATAVAAGMIPVGVLWGFRDRAELAAAGARHILREPSELLVLLERLG